MHCLMQAGLRVPEQVSVIGFDDIPEAAHAVTGLSTVATRPGDVGREASALLLRRIGAAHSAPERILIEPRLIVRQT